MQRVFSLWMLPSLSSLAFYEHSGTETLTFVKVLRETKHCFLNATALRGAPVVPRAEVRVAYASSYRIRSTTATRLQTITGTRARSKSSIQIKRESHEGIVSGPVASPVYERLSESLNLFELERGSRTKSKNDACGAPRRCKSAHIPEPEDPQDALQVALLQPLNPQGQAIPRPPNQRCSGG